MRREGGREKGRNIQRMKEMNRGNKEERVWKKRKEEKMTGRAPI